MASTKRCEEKPLRQSIEKSLCTFVYGKDENEVRTAYFHLVAIHNSFLGHKITSLVPHGPFQHALARKSREFDAKFHQKLSELFPLRECDSTYMVRLLAVNTCELPKWPERQDPRP